MSFFNNSDDNNKKIEEYEVISNQNKDIKPAGGELKKSDKDQEEGKESELAVDVFSSGLFIVVRALVGGAKLEDIDVSVTQDTVTIKGSRKAPDDSLCDGFYYHELYWGSFQRKIILPTGIDIDKVDATLHNGVLTVKVLKLDKAKEERVDIKAS